ncbi:YfgM family protein [Halothiobacillus sp. DCM-1]|uniref:YfgM family protein n=1 Tax=Halothiobacillus sp. DCM-1 TaxID=3112558 RepID=UPI003255AE8C
MTTADDEQLDQLRTLWAHYGKTLIAGLVLGLIVLGGWLGWQNWQARQQTAAALAFHQIEQLVRAQQPKAAMEAARQLATDHQGSIYAALALLVAGKEAMAQNDLPKAEIYLRDAMKNTHEPALIALAQLRLAKVQWAANQPSQALATLASPAPPPPYAGAFADLTGDIQASQKNWAAARAAYEQALSSDEAQAGFIQIKLDNLPASPSKETPAS